MTEKEVLQSVRNIMKFCEEQGGCQGCIFQKQKGMCFFAIDLHAPEDWEDSVKFFESVVEE